MNEFKVTGQTTGLTGAVPVSVGSADAAPEPKPPRCVSLYLPSKAIASVMHAAAQPIDELTGYDKLT